MNAKWPKFILADVRTSRNVRICESCEHFGIRPDTRPYCKLEPGEPCCQRIFVAVTHGNTCLLGKLEEGDLPPRRV